MTCQEFKRTRGNITSMREHAELLTSVRNDINEYKVSSMLFFWQVVHLFHYNISLINEIKYQASSTMQSAPNLLRERSAIHGSIIQVISNILDFNTDDSLIEPYIVGCRLMR